MKRREKRKRGERKRIGKEEKGREGKRRGGLLFVLVLYTSISFFVYIALSEL